MDLLKTKYKIYCNFDLNVNMRVLNYLYLPIIGSDAYILYSWLAQEINVQSALFKIKSSHERIFLSLEFDEKKFVEARSKLEAMNLLVSRIMIGDSNNDMYIYELMQPLSYEAFINNHRYKSLLINKITLSEFERLNLVFNNYAMADSGINVSSTFEMVYNTSLREGGIFDVKQIEESLEKETGKKIFISDEVISIIETFFRVYNLSIEKMKAKILECLIITSSGKAFIDPEKLRGKLSNTAETITRKIDLPDQLHRNINIFYNEIPESEKNLIINDYLIFNCEQYLSILQKSDLTVEQRKILSYLKQKQKLSDSIINVLVDYSVYKTHGSINDKYLKKLGKTINMFNFQDVYKVIHYLQQITLGIKNIDFQSLTKQPISEHDTGILITKTSDVKIYER